MVAATMLVVATIMPATARDLHNSEWARVYALRDAGKYREELPLLEHLYGFEEHSDELAYRVHIDEAQILDAEIEALRRIDDRVRLRAALALFARVADLTSDPSESSLPPMAAAPRRFAEEEKLFSSQLHSEWQMLPDKTAQICKVLRYAARGNYSDALSSLGSERPWTDPSDAVEVFWYYRAWIFVAEHNQAAAVNAFFATIAYHDPQPEGEYFSIQVSAAKYLAAHV